MNSCADTPTRSSRDRIAGVLCPNESTVRPTAQVGHIRFDTKQEGGRTPATVGRRSSEHSIGHLLSQASSPSPARTAGSVAIGSVLTPTPYAPSIIINSTVETTHATPHGDSKCSGQYCDQCRQPRRTRRRGSGRVQAPYAGDQPPDGFRGRRNKVGERFTTGHGDNRHAASTGERDAWPFPRATHRHSRAGLTPARTHRATGDRGTVARSWRVAARRGGGSRR